MGLAEAGEARHARNAATRLVLDNLDPSAARQAAKVAAQQAAARALDLPTFDEVTKEYVQKLRAEGQ